MKFGVVQFPGSCDDIDAFDAARRVGDATLLWHADRDLQGVDAVVVPGGFSYGDYLRAGAIARFAPVMEAVGVLDVEFDHPPDVDVAHPGEAERGECPFDCLTLRVEDPGFRLVEYAGPHARVLSCQSANALPVTRS